MVPFIIVKIVLIATVVAAITVGVIVGIIYGTVVENVSSCKSLQMPQFLEIVHFKNAIIPVWSSPDNSEGCEISYKVEYNDNEGTVQTIVTSGFSYAFETNPSACITITLSVTIVIDSESIGDPLVKNYEVGMGTVTNLDTSLINDVLQITWDRPLNSNKCQDMIYTVNYKGNSVSISNTTHNIAIADMFKCENAVITVTPMSAGLHGIDDSVNFETGIGSVSDITANENGNTVNISWTPPQNTESCGDLVYDISDGSNPSFNSTDPNFEFPIENLQKCDITWFTITPKAERFDGLEAKSGPVKIEIGSVSGITANENGNTVKIIWTPPQNIESCDDITYDISSGNFKNETKDNFIDVTFNDLNGCENITFTIIPQSQNEYRGISSDSEIYNFEGCEDHGGFT